MQGLCVTVFSQAIQNKHFDTINPLGHHYDIFNNNGRPIWTIYSNRKTEEFINFWCYFLNNKELLDKYMPILIREPHMTEYKFYLINKAGILNIHGYPMNQLIKAYTFPLNGLRVPVHFFFSRFDDMPYIIPQNRIPNRLLIGN